MRVRDIIQSASTNLWRNKGRTVLTIVAIFIGAFTISLTTGINMGINSYMDKQINNIGGENQMGISPKAQSSAMGGLIKNEPQEYQPEKDSGGGNTYLTKKNLESIEKIDGIAKAEPFRQLDVAYVQGVTNKKYLFSAANQSGVNMDLQAGRQVRSDGSYEVNLAPEYVKSLGFDNAKDALNKQVKLAVRSQATGEQEILEATVVGIRNVSVVQQGQSIVNTPLANKIVEIQESGLPDAMKDQYPMGNATMENNLSEKQIERIKEELDEEGFTGATVEDEIGLIRNIINAITGVLILFGAIALVAASFGIVNTLYMSVQDRTREIGLMKAMGLSRFKIFMTFSIEALLIGFWGGLIGVGAAMIVGRALNNVASTTFLEGLTGFQLIQFSYTSIIFIVLMIMLIAFLSGTLPANRAGKLDPITALRYE